MNAEAGAQSESGRPLVFHAYRSRYIPMLPITRCA
jgi:hypothetical protein